MRFGIGVERGKHDGENDLGIIRNEAHDIFVIPIIQRAFGNLEVRRRDAARQLLEERLPYLPRVKRRNLRRCRITTWMRNSVDSSRNEII